MITGRVQDEDGLRALEVILFDPVNELEELIDAIRDKMIAKFAKLHLAFQYGFMRIG